MTFLHRLLLFLLLVFVWSTSETPESSLTLACFAVIAGRKATEDGSVLVAHNEQNYPPALISFDRVPRQPFDRAVPERYRLPGRPVRPKQTASFLWSQCLPQESADRYLNEYGVAILSDRCRTREDDAEELARRGELRDGGIGYMLRRLVALQATTAREGVEIAGQLVEHFGYTTPGRTYIIADPNEAWLMALVGGRRWVAQRVADDAVVALPNVHVIRQFDLSDSAQFLGSKDVVDYAVRRGWYDKSVDGPFDFRKVYRGFKPDEEVVPEGVMTGRPDPPDPRRWMAYRLISGRDVPWPPKNPLPLWIKPREPMNVASMIAILRNRDSERPIGEVITDEAEVMQLRADLPRAVGCIYWRATCEPTCSVLTPWYLGIMSVPDYYHQPAALERRLTLDYQFNPPEGTFQPDHELAWWKFKTLQDRVHEDYDGRIGQIRPEWDKLENRLLADQKKVEQEAMRLWKKDRSAAEAYLTRYCADAAEEACHTADRLAAMFGPGGN